MIHFGSASSRSSVPGRTFFTMFLACSGIGIASSALAGVPSQANSTVPCVLSLVGTLAGVADSRGQFSIVVRDVANSPVPGSSVLIDFEACTPDIRVCSVQPFAGVTADCSIAVGKISAVTDGAGTVTLRIVGGARNTGAGSPAAGNKCATVFADGINLGTINVGAFDQNGGGGVSPADVSLWMSDYFTAGYEGRSDHDCSVTIAPPDLALHLSVSFSGGSSTSCAVYCH